jgi:mono/diheme cytochrome c family protein
MNSRSFTRAAAYRDRFDNLLRLLYFGLDRTYSAFGRGGGMAGATWLSVFAAVGVVASSQTRAEDPTELFEMKVRPILAQNCYVCHTATRSGGLQLDSRENILKGGNRGPAVVPGKPEESLLIQATSYSLDKLKMPPSGRLKDEEIATLKAWIKDGAIWPIRKARVEPAARAGQYVISPEQRNFWSFQPLQKAPLSEVKDKKWPRTPIDRFILAKLEEKSIKPVQPADKRTLIMPGYIRPDRSATESGRG